MNMYLLGGLVSICVLMIIEIIFHKKIWRLFKFRSNLLIWANVLIAILLLVAWPTIIFLSCIAGLVWIGMDCLET